MEETKMQIILESLAETIQKLRVDVIILKGENERLKKENKSLHEELEKKEGTIGG